MQWFCEYGSTAGHTHTYITSRSMPDCLMFLFLYPILHQSNISFKECVLLDKHMLTMGMCHSKWLNDWIIEVSCAFVTDGNTAYLSPIPCSLYTGTEGEESRWITLWISSSQEVQSLERGEEKVTARKGKHIPSPLLFLFNSWYEIY